MKGWLRKIAFGLKVAEKVAVMAGDHGLTIQGRNPAEIDRLAHAGAEAIIGALKKPPTPTNATPGVLMVGTTALDGVADRPRDE